MTAAMQQRWAKHQTLLLGLPLVALLLGGVNLLNFKTTYANDPQDLSISETLPQYDHELAERLNPVARARRLVDKGLCRLSLTRTSQGFLRATSQLSRMIKLDHAPTLYDLVDVEIEKDPGTRPFAFPRMVENTTGLTFRPIDSNRVLRTIPYSILGLEMMTNGDKARIPDELRGIKPKKNSELLNVYAERIRAWIADDLAYSFFNPMIKAIQRSLTVEFDDGHRGVSTIRSWPGHQAKLRLTESGAWSVILQGTLDFKNGRGLTFEEYYKHPENFQNFSSTYPVIASRYPLFENQGGAYEARLSVEKGYLLLQARLLNESVWHYETIPMHTLFRRSWKRGWGEPSKVDAEPRLSSGQKLDGGWAGYVFNALPRTLSSQDTYPVAPVHH